MWTFTPEGPKRTVNARFLISQESVIRSWHKQGRPIQDIATEVGASSGEVLEFLSSQVPDRTVKFPASVFNRIKRSADERGIKFKISKNYLWELYVSQCGECALSGLRLFLDREVEGAYRASLDRVESRKAYILGNVQWVAAPINIAKHVQSNVDFIELCRAVAKHNS